MSHNNITMLNCIFTYVADVSFSVYKSENILLKGNQLFS